MADQQPRKLWRIVLVISLALNLAVVGVVGGFMVRSSGDKGPPRSFDVGLGPIGRALDREDRRAIGAALRNAPQLRGSSRQKDEAILADFIAALRADPFSEAALVVVLEVPATRVAAVRETAITALTNRIVGMSVADRHALADRLAENGRGSRKP